MQWAVEFKGITKNYFWPRASVREDLELLEASLINKIFLRRYYEHSKRIHENW